MSAPSAIAGKTARKTHLRLETTAVEEETRLMAFNAAAETPGPAGNIDDKLHSKCQTRPTDLSAINTYTRVSNLFGQALAYSPPKLLDRQICTKSDTPIFPAIRRSSENAKLIATHTMQVMRLIDSTISSCLQDLRQLARAMPRPGCDWETRPEFLPPPKPAEFELIMKSFAETLPDDLLAFFELSGGIVGMTVHNGYRLCGMSDVAKNRQGDGCPPSEIATGDGIERVLTVALDGGGNAFLISPRSGAVWRWDHETGATARVAASFTAFLQQVVADWTAYVHGFTTWKYLV
jgi:hypothetical protein